MWFLGIDIEQLSVQDPRVYCDLDKINDDTSNMLAVNDLLLHTLSGHAFYPTRNSKQTLIRESSTWDAIYAINAHGYLPRKTSALPKFEGISCIIPVARNYCHWLFDELPFTLSAKKLMMEKEYLIHGNVTNYQGSANEFLNIVTKNVEKWVKLETTLIPKVRHLSGTPPIHILEELRHTFLGGIDQNSNTTERIYISRRNSARSLPEELAFEKNLEMEGIEILFLEDLNLFSQIAFFNKARVIIGPHGAGLANLVWANPGTKVFELMPDDFYNPCYSYLASKLQIEYHLVKYSNSYEVFKSL